MEPSAGPGGGDRDLRRLGAARRLGGREREGVRGSRRWLQKALGTSDDGVGHNPDAGNCYMDQCHMSRCNLNLAVTDLTQSRGPRRSEPLTIDELAAQVGMTVRNVRAHQSRGLLPPPEIQGRTGYYGPEHVARLELVKDLQAEGFNLEAIKRIVERTPGSSSAAVLDFTRALAEPFTDEPPEIVDAEHFTERWGKQASHEALSGRSGSASCGRSATAASRSSARAWSAPRASSRASGCRSTCARPDRNASSATRRRREGLRAPVPRPRLAPVPGVRRAGGALARGARGARAAAPARRRVADRDLRRRDDRRRRTRAGARAGADGAGGAAARARRRRRSKR